MILIIKFSKLQSLNHFRPFLSIQQYDDISILYFALNLKDMYIGSTVLASYCPILLIYCIAQNSGREKLLRISDFKVLVRKTLVNA